MPRTNIAVDARTADSLAEEATRENKSLYALSNEALAAVLRVCKDGGSPRDVYPSWRMSRILKDTDAIPLPGDFVEKLMKKVFAIDREWLLKEWFDEGKRIGSYLHMYAQEFQQLVHVIDELKGLLPVKRVEIERVEEQGRTSVLVRVIGAGFSHESTRCTEQFLIGILSAYPYKIKDSKVSEGLIEVRVEEEKNLRT